jgi:NAD(P)-dependent dehydrogenase (short-subunit alcohol dehydrogenase family)
VSLLSGVTRSKIYADNSTSDTDEFRKTFADRIAMRHMGTEEDIAHAVLFLSSDYATWIAGQVLPVTGSPIA